MAESYNKFGGNKVNKHIRYKDEQSKIYYERLETYLASKKEYKAKCKQKGKTKQDKKELKNMRKNLKTEKDIVKRIKPRNLVQRFFFRVSKFLKVFMVWFLVFCAATGIVGYIVTAPLIKEAKDIAYEKLASVDENTFNFLTNTTVYDADGNLLSTIVKSNYSYTDINEVPEYIQKGYIAVEDRRFLSHNGIDIKSLARAGIALIKNKGEITQGGSTITQQVVKNMLLSQEQTYKRKLIEMFIAPELEKRYSKSDIMEFYVNSCYYGNGCYGVGSASSYFFGKTPMELTLAECAMLVGLSNNPTAYSPVNNPENAKDKRTSVLNQMLEQGVITIEEYNGAVNEEFNLVLQEETPEKEPYETSYAIHCATIKLMELNNFNFEYVFTDEDAYNAYRERYTNVYNQYSQEIRAGGYTLYTSLNPELQVKLQESVDNGLSGFKEKDELSGKYLMQGAAVTVDNKTGYVVAIVGGRGTDDEFNRGFLAKRQPGSTMKPLAVYGPAMDTGRYYPSLIMEDKYIDGGPQNYGRTFSGDVTLRRALARSLNTIPFQILLDIKPLTGLQYLGKMHFDTLVPSDNVGSLALGGMTYGTRVCDIAKAYYTIQNDGIYTDNTCITKIDFQQKGTIYNGSINKERVYEQDVAYILTDMLKTVATGGTGVSVPNHPTGGKTGTTSDNKDGWYVGFTKYYTTAVWVGYDTPKEITTLARDRYPVKIWQSFMNDVHKDLTPEDWTRPSTVVDKYVDNLGNMTDKNTGKTELFSQTLIDREEEANKVKESELLKAYEDEWLAKDAERQSLAEASLKMYEGMNCESVEDLDKIDRVYKETLTAINLISDYTVKQSMLNRLETRKVQLDAQRKPFEEMQQVIKEQEEEQARKAEEERKKQLAEEQKIREEQLAMEKEAKLEADAKAKANLLLKADTALKELESLSPYDSTAFEKVVNAQACVEACSTFKEYDSLLSRLNSETKRLRVLEVDSGDNITNNTGSTANSNQVTTGDSSVVTPNP